MRKFVFHVEKWVILWAVGLSAAVLLLDYMTGPYIAFPIAFIFPVALLAWFRPCWWAIALATLLCFVRMDMSFYWITTTKFDPTNILINTCIRMVVLFLVAFLFARVAKQQHALEARVRTLEGILPVCGFCKKIRNEEDEWEKIETYISRHSEAEVSHTVCPTCSKSVMPDFVHR